MTVTIDWAVVSVVFFVLLNIAGWIWAASKLNSRVAALEEWVKENKDVPALIVKMGTAFDGFQKALDRIMTRLDKIEDRERERSQRGEGR